jgi:hypothetical protein
MKVANGSVKNSYITAAAGNSRKNNPTRNTLWLLREKCIKRYQEVLGILSAVIFTTSLFLGGSYLFFIQLAEYGW